jgi:hypothetical protein
MTQPFKSETPDIGEETAAYTTPVEEREWWQLHKYKITELAALVSVITFVTSIVGHGRKFFK